MMKMCDIQAILLDRAQQQAELEAILHDTERRTSAAHDAMEEMLRRLNEAFPECGKQRHD